MTTTETTAPTPAAVNRPAPPRTFGFLARWIRRWLGIADQQHDFDALGMTLSVKDQMIDADRQRLGQVAAGLDQVAAQLNRTTNGFISVNDRLTWHEQHVPSLGGSRKSYDLTMKREKARREQLIEQHPELTPAEQQHVRATGKLPQPAHGKAPAEVPPA
jgi:hypothetical protein